MRRLRSSDAHDRLVATFEAFDHEVLEVPRFDISQRAAFIARAVGLD